jgi:hypothetical protein
VDSAALQDLVPSLALGIGLAACAGLRAWLPLLLTGVLARLEYIQLGPAFHFLTTNRALALFGVATVVELVGDKIPAVDHALDAIGTVLRPVAGALLAASVLWEVQDPLTAVALGVVVGAPSALVPHAAKSALRALSTTLTAGIANPLLSLFEDALALCVFILAVLLPLLVALLVAFAAVLVLRRLGARRAAPPALPPIASA